MSSTSSTQIPNWNMKADYVETCNCDYGRPCNFSGFPTYGNCNTTILYHIRTGNYGNTKLDGLLLVYYRGLRLSMKVTVLLCCSLQIKRMKNKERQLYRLFLDRQRESVLHYSQVLMAVFLNHNSLILTLK